VCTWKQTVVADESDATVAKGAIGSERVMLAAHVLSSMDVSASVTVGLQTRVATPVMIAHELMTATACDAAWWPANGGNDAQVILRAVINEQALFAVDPWGDT
jgi:hypothetical protein